MPGGNRVVYLHPCSFKIPAGALSGLSRKAVEVLGMNAQFLQQQVELRDAFVSVDGHGAGEGIRKRQSGAFWTLQHERAVQKCGRKGR